MRIRATITLTAACLTALATLTACGGTGSTTSGTGVDKPAAVQDPNQDNTKDEDDSNDQDVASTETATLPNLVGKGLQVAQDQAQEAGFYGLTSHDALGRARLQAFDRYWQVCSQTPKAGEHPTDARVDFATVKLDETCPAEEEGAEPVAAGSKMPDVKGKSVKPARQALDSNAGITINDASGQDRFVLVESNWQVCTQEPAAGAELDGRPVTLTAVKYGEPC
ncbi:PASTA domain-containing protein [Streptomyces sp. NBC_00878]|uniref:PASTA domain-containing protein n=1 Tax=Streptomyces sp. NBC_00878 TaxID=2975854 RepID=UPI0022534528|nr:PASTA domain-containing protein [Streptomyces sp. NBC_00878]MCX4909222.1 PASTA domain-containing protein [Streptomyces sp. NBC_00878]